ncbi:MAG TPA: hypothetical protein VGK39_02740 [Cyclobacteriaceae bacterium]
MTRFFIIILIFTASNLFSQSAVKLDSYFSQLRSGKSPNIPVEVYKPENAKSTLAALSVYSKDTLDIVRSKAALIARAVGTRSAVSAIRQQSVTHLIQAANDKSTGYAGSALNYLTEFKKTDFTKAHRDSLTSLFRRNPPYIDVLAKLAGFLEIKELQNELFAMSQQTTLGRKERWSAILALARMNDERAVNDMMSRVKRMPVTDGVVYEVFPDMVYTRRPEAIAYMVEALNSDAKNCNSADAEREARIPCAYRVMEMLAPVVEGYPLKLDESGDVDVKDYPTALQLTRDWFTKNKNYKIVTATF